MLVLKLGVVAGAEVVARYLTPGNREGIIPGAGWAA